jgi:hypothetical protein
MTILRLTEDEWRAQSQLNPLAERVVHDRLVDLRDYFATHAMMRYHYSDHTLDESMAMRCYQIADAMLKERDKGKA